jgi:hypothetical protein
MIGWPAFSEEKSLIQLRPSRHFTSQKEAIE